MPSAIPLATDLSAVALANSTHGLGHVNVAAANELEKVRSTPGIARRATWVAAPKRRFHRRFPPAKSPPSSTADTPCRLPKPARIEVLSIRARFTLEGAGAFART
jgi:hypothetical protein